MTDASMDLTFQTETEITPDEFIDVLRRSTLAERRPIDERETIKAMLEHADLIVTARSSDLLVGVSRAITDFAHCTYLSEFLEADAHDFDVAKPFDAVFSNAALHWITEPARVIDCIARALKPNGRLAVEFGGKGNVHYLADAIETACRMTLGETVSHPWYFPSIAEFATLLEPY